MGPPLEMEGCRFCGAMWSLAEGKTCRCPPNATPDPKSNRAERRRQSSRRPI